MEVSGQFHVPTALPTDAEHTGGWAGPTVGLSLC
jgi:hypothetical protein